MQQAFHKYITDVKERKFPAPEHANSMDSQEFRDLISEIEMLEADIEPDDTMPNRFH